MDVITRQKLIKGIKAGDIWLNKVKYEGTKTNTWKRLP